MNKPIKLAPPKTSVGLMRWLIQVNQGYGLRGLNTLVGTQIEDFANRAIPQRSARRDWQLVSDWISGIRPTPDWVEHAVTLWLAEYLSARFDAPLVIAAARARGMPKTRRVSGEQVSRWLAQVVAGSLVRELRGGEVPLAPEILDALVDAQPAGLLNLLGHILEMRE